MIYYKEFEYKGKMIEDAVFILKQYTKTYTDNEVMIPQGRDLKIEYRQAVRVAPLFMIYRDKDSYLSRINQLGAIKLSFDYDGVTDVEEQCYNELLKHEKFGGGKLGF